MRKIILEGIRFRFITRKGVCYGKLGDKWAYVHYVSHANGTTYMVDVPKKDVLDVARGRINWNQFEHICLHYWRKEQEQMAWRM